MLADEVGRQALHCIRCSACLNVCPVYSRTGGQAYESVYPGPDRRDPHAAAARAGPGADAAVGLVAVRRLLRGVPGQDRHPERAGPPARAGRARGEASARPRGAGDGRRRQGVLVAAALRGRAEALASSAAARSGGCRCRAGARCGSCRRCPTQTFREWWRAGERRAMRSCGRVRAALGDAPSVPDVPARLPRAGRGRRPTSTCSASASPTTRRPSTASPPAGWTASSPRCCAAHGARRVASGTLDVGRRARRRRPAARLARARRARRRHHRLRARDRRDGHDRARRRRALRPPRADARARPPPVRGRGGADRRRRARRRRPRSARRRAPGARSRWCRGLRRRRISSSIAWRAFTARGAWKYSS